MFASPSPKNSVWVQWLSPTLSEQLGGFQVALVSAGATGVWLAVSPAARAAFSARCLSWLSGCSSPQSNWTMLGGTPRIPQIMNTGQQFLPSPAFHQSQVPVPGLPLSQPSSLGLWNQDAFAQQMMWNNMVNPYCAPSMIAPYQVLGQKGFPALGGLPHGGNWMHGSRQGDLLRILN